MSPSQSKAAGAAGDQRAPALASAVDRQIATSNATANAFLGGRQLSWMTPGSTARRPNPRPAIARPSAPAGAQPQAAPAVLPSPAPSDEPSPAISLDSPKSRPASLPDAPNMAPTAAKLPVSEARFVPRGQELGAPDVQEVPAPTAATRSPVPQNHRPSLTLDTTRPPAVANESLLPPPKRRRTEPVSAAQSRCAPLLAHIDIHVQTCGGEDNLDRNVEKPRIVLLREACKAEDEFFLAVHQLFSIWSRCRQDAYQIFPISQPELDCAFSILETVLKKNSLVSPTHRLWFARFPNSIDQLLAREPGGQYPPLVLRTGAFLQNLVREYDALIRATSNRKYPVLVDELLSLLGCYSPVLQKILFTASRRRLGVHDGALGSRMDQAFCEDQDRHRGGPYNLPVLTGPTMSPAGLEQRNAPLISLYRQIVAEATTLRAQARSALQSPPPAASLSPTSSFQQPGFADYFPPATNPHQHQAAVTPSTVPTPFPAFASAAVPISSPVLTSSTRISFASHRDGTVAIQRGSPNRISTPQQQTPTPTDQAPQYLAAGGSLQSQLNQAESRRASVIQGQQQQQQQQQEQELHARFSMLYNQYQQQVQQDLNRHQYQPHLQHHGHLVTQAGFSTPAPTRPGPPPPSLLPAQPVQTMQSMRQIQQMPLAPQMVPFQRIQLAPATQSPANGVVGGPAQAAPSIPQHLQRSIRQQMATQVADPLLPSLFREITRPEFPYDPSDRKATLMSLHQAHVRSPKRIVKSGETERFYQAVKSLPVEPVAVPPRNTLYEFRFEVTEEQLALVAGKSITARGLLPVIEHFNGALRWRVRCCLVPNSLKPPPEQQWVTLDVNWPPHIFMTFNGHSLEIRRQPHNGKDLPTEITEFVTRGTNILKIGLPDAPGPKARDRFVAVELVETLSHSTIIDFVWSRGVIPEQETLETINKRLARSNDPADDDVILSEPDLSIDLADPFSATIFRVPARGADCSHMECFDLETWLETRPPSKPHVKCRHGSSGGQSWCGCVDTPEPSHADKWRCPICSKDARPYSLRIDGFLLGVRKKLEEEGKLGAKNVRVRSGGEWVVVGAVGNEEESDDDEADGYGEGRAGGSAGGKGKGRTSSVPAAGPGGGTAAGGRRQEVEVIEIDDD
ncbi:hypothetical protein VTK26DRAFT_764 [Humicola hyalothermophila]